MVDSEKKKIKITVRTKKKKANNNTDNLLGEAQSTSNEVALALLLVKALRESLLFARSDRGGEEQGGNFVLGSIQRLSSDMWKNKKEVI
jgi:hypothetical protein